jgi:hypothetical protein
VRVPKADQKDVEDEAAPGGQPLVIGLPRAIVLEEDQGQNKSVASSHAAPHQQQQRQREDDQYDVEAA